LELVQSSDAGSTLLAGTTSFVDMFLDGLCHDDFRHIFFGGRLIALNKKSGGIRPIAIVCTWRRLAAKCANAFACNKLVSLLLVVIWKICRLNTLLQSSIFTTHFVASSKWKIRGHEVRLKLAESQSLDTTGNTDESKLT
jgi:hypothetical protein